jgi:hypothetical protein
MTKKYTKAELENNIDAAVSALYVAFYHMRQNNEIKMEYECMGTLMDMLSEDRASMREKYGNKVIDE